MRSGRSSILFAVIRETSSRSSTRRGEQRELAIADLDASLAQRLARALLREIEQRAQRRERVAQLVREDREELVLAMVGLGELLVEAGELELGRGLVRRFETARAAVSSSRSSGLQPRERLRALLEREQRLGLRAQDLRRERLEQEVDRAELVRAQDVLRLAFVRGHEDDRHEARARRGRG